MIWYVIHDEYNVTGKGGNVEINTKQELNRESLDLKIQHSITNELIKV